MYYQKYTQCWKYIVCM